MEEPESDRLQWLGWFDADTIILNRLTPLETFLPPADMLNVHAIVTRDWNDLNDGVFFLRVSTWSIEMLSAVLAYRTFKPVDKLTWGEQSAMESVLREADFADGAVFVPARWFNSYPSGDAQYVFQHGDLSLYSAGVCGKDGLMQEWLYRLEINRTLWEVPLEQTNLTDEVGWFWHGVKLKLHGEQKQSELAADVGRSKGMPGRARLRLVQCYEWSMEMFGLDDCRIVFL